MAKPRAALRKPESFKLNISGTEKEFFIRTLVRRDAMLVMHTVIRPVLKGVVDMVATKTKNGSMKSGLDPAEMVVGFQKLIEATDFETLESIAVPLFDQASVDNEEIDFEDYFGDHPLELYPAVYQALSLNYPDVFRILQPLMANASATLKDLATEKQPPAAPSPA